jgi:hypothetical protein
MAQIPEHAQIFLRVRERSSNQHYRSTDLVFARLGWSTRHGVFWAWGAIRPMKAWQAWREAAKLFGRRPALSLPVLTAAIFPVVINTANHWFMRWLLPSPIEANGVQPPLSQTLLQPVKAYWPLILGDLIVQVVICVTALLVTAGAVRRLKSEDATALLRYGMIFARSQWRGAMWMSLAGFVLFAIYDAARFAVFYVSVTHVFTQMITYNPSWQFEVSALYTFLWCIGVWILAGMAMRRIGTDGFQKITRAQVWDGKQLAIAAVLFSAVLGFALTCLRRTVIPEGGLDGTVTVWELNALQSLIASLPYVLLFIALTRIVDQDDNFMT